jgi:hypothetical protein
MYAMAPWLLRDLARHGADTVAMAHATVASHALPGCGDGSAAVAGDPAAQYVDKDPIRNGSWRGPRWLTET